MICLPIELSCIALCQNVKILAVVTEFKNCIEVMIHFLGQMSFQE